MVTKYLIERSGRPDRKPQREEMDKKKKTKQICLGLLMVALLVFLDQWTKALAIKHLKGQEAYVIIKDVFVLRYLENRGAAFSSLTGKTVFLLALTGVIMLGVLWIYVIVPETKKWRALRMMLIAVMAGGLGNFIDRIRYHYVVDFLYFQLIDFPTFNVADIYVTVAVASLFILFFFVYKDADWEELMKNFPKWLQGKEKNQ